MEEFFKEYKNKPNKELLDMMMVLKEEFDKTKSILINLTLHKELDNRKPNK